MTLLHFPYFRLTQFHVLSDSGTLTERAAPVSGIPIFVPKRKSMNHELYLNHTICIETFCSDVVYITSVCYSCRTQGPISWFQLGDLLTSQRFLAVPVFRPSHRPESITVSSRIPHIESPLGFKSLCTSATSQRNSLLLRGSPDQARPTQTNLIFLKVSLFRTLVRCAKSFHSIQISALKLDQAIFKSWFIHLPICTLDNLFNM